ncbi:hypothetical protein TPHA_0O00200 [Tetrapisispora phaffii CBS 4417]|uniref:Proteasome assembly chaperone 2 n=1 Tax=Tetrapisispora phaffii (strain ATCC 24235 / CBS 4417 / NBRC 1672 / NRRL Y-8282 / UCD 70-5) TaxID=1071381 RepID=G8C1G4_TETPH|nr:hypothetical protein TPHA_0O00200 [Tetrapisispora phaffii CBS 4417]CCE65992.1 hypothetical protein TPHA_0O00200 [Tetrapisispora phaffii CBS 4417]
MPSLILPLVSTGNVPQLCVDLLLHSVSDEFEFLANVDSTYLHPFVGPLDHLAGQDSPVLYAKTPSKKYTTPMELFATRDKEVYVLQQRTPVIEGYLNNFVKTVLVPLVMKLEIDEIVILDSFGSLDEDLAVPSSISTRCGNPLSVGTINVSSISDMSNIFESNLHLDTDTMQHVSKSLYNFAEDSLQREVSTSQQIFKYTYHLLNSQITSLKEIKYCSLFVHEGDNSYDAQTLCQKLPEIVPNLPVISSFKPPISWTGVYGFNPAPTAFDEGLYM